MEPTFPSCRSWSRRGVIVPSLRGTPWSPVVMFVLPTLLTTMTLLVMLLLRRVAAIIISMLLLMFAVVLSGVMLPLFRVMRRGWATIHPMMTSGSWPVVPLYDFISFRTSRPYIITVRNSAVSNVITSLHLSRWSRMILILQLTLLSRRWAAVNLLVPRLRYLVPIHFCCHCFWHLILSKLLSI